MPRKSHSSIGRDTKHAKRSRLRIKNETVEERELRAAKNRERNFLRRSRETSVQRELRLSRDRNRHRSNRAKEWHKRKRMNTPNLRPNNLVSDMHDETSIECKNEPVDSDMNDDYSIEYKYEPVDPHINDNFSIEFKYEPVDSDLNDDSPIECRNNEPVDSIDTISIVCENCSALACQCCLPGKVKTEEILPPPEPLHSL